MTQRAPSKAACVQMARDGELEALHDLAGTPGVADRDVYKWLCAAEDFGHDEAAEYAESVVETSSLRYDDDGIEVAAARFELALAYLTGDDGLPHRLDLAHRQLDRALASHEFARVAATSAPRHALDAAQPRLGDLERALIDYHRRGGDRYGRVATQIGLLESMLQADAPTMMVAEQADALRAAFDALVAGGEAALAAPPGIALDAPRSLKQLRARVDALLQAAAAYCS